MASKNKMVIRAIKDGKLIVGPPAENRPCKTCTKKPRRDGSSYCQDCATIHQEQRFEANQLKKRIDEAKRSSEIKPEQKK